MLSPRLFLVVLVSLALSMTATGYVSALAQRAYGGNMAAMGALTGKVEELYAGNRVVKVFNRSLAAFGRFEEDAREFVGNIKWATWFNARGMGKLYAAAGRRCSCCCPPCSSSCPRRRPTPTSFRRRCCSSWWEAA